MNPLTLLLAVVHTLSTKKTATTSNLGSSIHFACQIAPLMRSMIFFKKIAPALRRHEKIVNHVGKF